MIWNLIGAAVLGFLVYLVGCAFDKSPDNKNAGLAGLIVFVMAFLVFAGFLS